jgi:hypothetical protein
MHSIYVCEWERRRAAGGHARLVRGVRGARAQRCCECQPNVFHDRGVQYKSDAEASKSENTEMEVARVTS